MYLLILRNPPITATASINTCKETGSQIFNWRTSSCPELWYWASISDKPPSLFFIYTYKFYIYIFTNISLNLASCSTLCIIMVKISSFYFSVSNSPHGMQYNKCSLCFNFQRSTTCRCGIGSFQSHFISVCHSQSCHGPCLCSIFFQLVTGAHDWHQPEVKGNDKSQWHWLF